MYKWIFKDSFLKLHIEKYKREFFGNDAPFFADILTNMYLRRGVTTLQKKQEFLSFDVKGLENPFLIKGMDRAVDRIHSAMDNGENILLYGDYDVDGTTSVALLYNFLTEIYPNVSYYTPDRYSEGYGFSKKGVDFAFDNDISLIITLDCGTSDSSTVEYATSKGIDVIVSDHHTPSCSLPVCVAVLNPHQSGCPYPYKDLCGCGISFKIAHALCLYLGIGENKALKYLYFACIATCADIVPMTGENRLITHLGLLLLRAKKPRFFSYIISDFENITQDNIIFDIAPKINAAGRMQHSCLAVELMTSKDPIRIEELSRHINSLNSHRKELCSEALSEALSQLCSTNQTSSNLVYDKSWSKGVIGIVASKLIERDYKPTIVFTQSGDEITGSARSVSTFDLFSVICQCSDLLIRFGGHKYAAGLTLSSENFPIFKQRFESLVSEQIMPHQKVRTLEIEDEIPFSFICKDFKEHIYLFSPFGPQNKEPIFATGSLRLSFVRCIGKGGEHLSFTATDSQGISFRCVAFSMGHLFSSLRCDALYSLAYRFEIDTYRNDGSLQLMVLDIKES